MRQNETYGLSMQAEFVANYHIKIGTAKELVKIDTEHFEIEDHGHCQVCIR